MAPYYLVPHFYLHKIVGKCQNELIKLDTTKRENKHKKLENVLQYKLIVYNLKGGDDIILLPYSQI